ncbi:MAG TPA: response regulator transcription factor [Propionicimonas sp.]
MATPARVLVVDDHALFRDGLISLIGRWSEFEVVGSAGDGREALALVGRLAPDLVLMDVRMEGMGGVEATKQITAVDSRVRIAMLTVSNLGEDVFEALRNGAHGYLSKNETAEHLRESLQGIMRGEAVMSSTIAAKVLAEFAQPDRPGAAGETGAERLSRRELEVLSLLVEGLSNDEIAHTMHLSEATVKKHLGSIMAKLHLRNRVQVAVFGVRRGIVG